MISPPTVENVDMQIGGKKEYTEKELFTEKNLYTKKDMLKKAEKP